MSLQVGHIAKLLLRGGVLLLGYDLTPLVDHQVTSLLEKAEGAQSSDRSSSLPRTQQTMAVIPAEGVYGPCTWVLCRFSVGSELGNLQVTACIERCRTSVLITYISYISDDCQGSSLFPKQGSLDYACHEDLGIFQYSKHIHQCLKGPLLATVGHADVQSYC